MFCTLCIKCLLANYLQKNQRCSLIISPILVFTCRCLIGVLTDPDTFTLLVKLAEPEITVLIMCTLASRVDYPAIHGFWNNKKNHEESAVPTIASFPRC